MTRKLLILGASGFLGTHVTQSLLDNQIHDKIRWEIILNLSPGHPIRRQLLEHGMTVQHPLVKPTWADIEDYYELRDVTKDVHTCLNASRLPWTLKAHRKAGIEYENMVDTILQACLANGVQKTIHVSCALVFGPSQKKHSISKKIPRTLKTKPRSVPQFVKELEREFRHLQEYVVERKFPISVIYFPFLFGTGETHIMGDLMLDHLLNHKNSMLKKLVLDKKMGNNHLNLLSVKDAVAACRHVISDPSFGQQHLVGGANITLQELLDMWTDVISLPTTYNFRSFCQNMQDRKGHWLYSYLKNNRFKSKKGQLCFRPNKELMKLLRHDWRFTSINYQKMDHAENGSLTESTLEETARTLHSYAEELMKVVEGE